MVDFEFETEDMQNINKYLNDYFNGKKAPKLNKKIVKLLRKVTIITERYEEIDLEDEEDVDD